MFFSTNAPNLPRVGECVRIKGSVEHDRPYEVMGRAKDKATGQVWFDVQFEGKSHRFKAEQLDFWPSEGDTVLIAMGPYLDWLARQLNVGEWSGDRLKQIQARFQACQKAGKTTEQLCQNHYLDAVEGIGVEQMGGVRRKGGDLFLIPVRCLFVLEKKDRRTDSKIAQETIMAEQLNLLGDAA